MPVHGYTIEYNPRTGAGWQAIADGDVNSASMTHRVSGNGDNLLIPGDDAEASGSISVRSGAIPMSVFNQDVPPLVRATYRVDGAPAKALVGTASRYTDDGKKTGVQVDGLKKLISGVRVPSPMFFRPVATATTNASIEDPLASGYAAGLINWLMWQAGGRPLQQAGTYPDALFYYDFRNAVVTPPYSWTAGDNAWQDAQKLAQASCGRLYQSEAGTICYRSVLSLTGTGSGIVFDAGQYGALSVEGTWDQTCTGLQQTVVPRAIGGWQHVIDDTTPRRILVTGEPLQFPLAPQYPVALWGRVLVYATDFGGRPLTMGTDFTLAYVPYAQQIAFTITNNRSEPILINRITADGRPLNPGEATPVTIGSAPFLSLTDSEFIQTRSQAERVLPLLLKLYKKRATYRLTDCKYEINRYVGGIVRVTSARYGLTDVPCVITERSDNKTGLRTDYTVVPIGDLPGDDQLFLFDVIYDGNAVRKLGY